MGFIERLRSQKEQEARTRSQKEAELNRKREIEEAARQQREAHEKELHEKNRRYAEACLQESGVESLIVELAEFIHSYHWRGNGLGDTEFTRRSGRERIVPTLATDPDSVSVGIVWDEVKKGSKSVELTSRRYGADMEKWDEFEGKFIAVECRPDRNIIFHARGNITVPEQKWKNNKDILDRALERSYKTPRIQRYKGNFLIYSSYADLG